MSKQHSNSNRPIPVRELAQRLRLLYSWQEALALYGDRPLRAGAATERRVQNAIAESLQAARMALDSRASDLRQVIRADQERPGNLVIEEKLEQLRHEITQYNWLLKAKSSADLGGMVEFPLEHYPVELGMERAPGQFQLERDDFITLAASALIIVVSCLAITWYNLWRQDVAFTVERADAAHVAVHFSNSSNFATQLYGPWPQSDVGLDGQSFGVKVFCRAVGASDFQDATSLRDAWSYQGQPISPLKPIQVEAGLSVAILLDLENLETLYGAPLEEIRITGGNRRNREQFEFHESRHIGERLP